MRSQETPVSGLIMHLLLMHLRQWEWRFSIFSVLLLAQLLIAAKRVKFNPETKSANNILISQAVRSPIHAKLTTLFLGKHTRQ